jgi:hypothetical protein
MGGRKSEIGASLIVREEPYNCEREPYIISEQRAPTHDRAESCESGLSATSASRYLLNFDLERRGD